MQRLFLYSALALLSAGTLPALSGVAVADITIAAGGKSDFSIVIPQNAPHSLKNAAQELQKDIVLATRAEISIREDAAPPVGKVISLGATRQAKAAGISMEKTSGDDYRIVTRAGNVYIIGPDSPGEEKPNGGASAGTANGVYSFLEEYLDVRWLMPGDLGRDVPTRGTFTIPEINRTEAPCFNWRQLPYIQNNRPAVQLWEEQQRTRFYPLKMDATHRWASVVPPSMFEKHPEWFAMLDGQRSPVPPSRAVTYKLETTNPELVRYYAEQAVKGLKENPHLSTFSLSPNDNHEWSESPESKALYDPTPPPIGQRVSVTPLILKWYNDVAQLVAKEYPQGKLDGFIYQDYMFPPTIGDIKLPSNFVPVIAPSFDYGYQLYKEDRRQAFTRLMEGWSKVVPQDWYYYDLPNNFSFGDASTLQEGNSGLITPVGARILDFIFPQLVKHNLRGARIYGTASWSNAAVTNYVMAKLLWNPELKAADVQREWLQRAYGPQAGAAMEQFYEKLEDAFEEYGKVRPIGYWLLDGYLKDIYAPHYPALEAAFLQAKAAPMTSTQKQRLQLIEDNLIVLQWRLRNKKFLAEDFSSPLRRDDKAVAAIAQKSNPDFDPFPLIPEGRQKISPLQVRLAVEALPAKPKAPPALGFNDTYLFYAALEGELRLNPLQVEHGSFIANYQWRTASDAKVLAEGPLTENTPLAFPVKANTAYLLSIPANKGVAYQLALENTSQVQGAFQDGALRLRGPDAPLWFYYPPGKDSGVSVQPSTRTGAPGLLLTKGRPQDKNLTSLLEQLQKKSQHAATIQNLSDNWNFYPDRQNNGLQIGVANLEFDDSSWETVAADDWWQNQGFAAYHGTAWYRKELTAPKLQPEQAAFLYFGGIDGNAVIYLNGKKIGEHHVGAEAEGFKGWDAPLTLDVTETLQPGRNLLAVQVTSKPIGSSGIYKGVSLLLSGTK